jgi:predicted dehydrogenase
MPSTKKLRWGILGVARITERLLPAFAKATNAEVCAIASRSLDRARAAARAAGIPTAYGSYEALLDDPSLDAIYNPLPNTLHAEWTMKAAERGKHIVCEKPLAPTAARAREVVEFCRARGVCLMDGFMWPHHPRTARLRQFLDSGSLGEVRRVAGAFTFRMEKLDPTNIRLQSSLAGGCLLDVGCYPVFAIRWVFGAEPIKTYASARYAYGVDVEMSGMLWLVDGRIGTFDCGFTLPYRGWLEITGTEGTIWVPDMWLPPRRATFEIRRHNKRDIEEVVVDGEDQIVHLIENFGRAVFQERPLRPPPDEAVKTLRLLDALAASAQSAQPRIVP